MPFTSLQQAIAGTQVQPTPTVPSWSTSGEDLWYATTVALLKPAFCTGKAGSCDFCVVLGRHVGDKDVLSY